MEEDFQDLKIEDNYDVNILLLGETGVGKSTFINSIANYLHHHNLEKAIQEDLFYLIPCMFNITDENYRPQKVLVGSDDNEYQLVGDSATQDVRTYVFPIGNGKTRLRLIDSPGMGDPRGVEQDDQNCENILSYIGQLHHLHAICLLFRPNDARITITFEYCVKQILSRLDKSAARNILFVFTNGKATNYKPGETIACLKKVVEDIKKQPPYVDIKVDDNVFCFDNEAFRFLAAVKKGIKFTDNTKEEYFKSWKNSSTEAWKLIKYIVGDVGRDPLEPHMVKSSKCVNEARRVINQLAQPMADISQLILDNLQILDRRQKELQQDNMSLDNLRGKLYVPVINLQVIKLTQPATVCCDPKCAEFVKIEDRNTWNYKQRCHDPCHLRNVPRDIIGAPQLEHCAAMDIRTQTCMRCGCAQTVHMHIYYMTKKFDDKKMDTNVQKEITSTEKALAEAERVIGKIVQRKTELEFEKEVIIDCAAKFAIFLQNNAITPFNDAYRKYLNYMIFREKSLGESADQLIIQHFQDLLVKYDQIKSTFDKVKEMSGKAGGEVKELQAQDIQTILNKLYSLKHNGKKIKELYSSQKTSRKKEYEQTEYVHSSTVKQPEINANKTKSQSDEDKNKTKKQGKKQPENNVKNYHQHGIHKNKPNQQNFNKHLFQNLNKDNVTVVTQSQGTKKQIKIEINESRSDNERKKNQNKNQQGNTKLFVLNNKGPGQNKNSQGQAKQQDGKKNNQGPTHIFSNKQSNSQNNPTGSYKAPYQARENIPPPPYDATRPTHDPRSPSGPYDYRPPYDARPPYDYRPPQDGRPPYDPRSPYDSRPPYDPRSPHDARPPYDPRSPHDARPPYDPRSPHDTRPPYDYRPPYDARPPYDPRSPPDTRPPYDYRPPYDARPPYDPRSPNDARPAYDARPPYDPRSPNDARPAYDARPPYDPRSPNDARPAYDARPPYDPRSPNDARPAYDARPPWDVRPSYDARPPNDTFWRSGGRSDTQKKPSSDKNNSDGGKQRRRRRRNNDSGNESFKSCDDSD